MIFGSTGCKFVSNFRSSVMSKLSLNSIVSSPSDDDDKKTNSRSSQDSLNGRTHALEIIQSPLRSAAFGSSYYSRLPLSPALVVRLVVRNAEGHAVDIHEELPFYVCHASLLSEDAESHVDVTQPTEDADSVPLRMLYGALVTTPYQARGEVVFPFTDLGVRVCGIYRLKISLFRLARPGSEISSSTASETLSTAITDTFEIVELCKYEAPAITNLSYELHAAGVPIQIPDNQQTI
ncbi:hypothetical protein E3P89_00991 [Wallemia ichthyophaga]|uniref:Velvet domain-containing protein n=1 Tax=Wallemia ichthyophaga TaxID=245174 RepID=A0A4T0IH50_WALIC|nr:hypothetical protein E3P95_01999 [Wallemia ichthyophaga]TIB00559.1 hypothetical protein E3P94_02123 [Wallemia ichthyophaga]TIB14358.1 hypothetical protein E3P90_01286 [Wallemia ichthyophaga]TIB16214.1 hypothetical protein E3P93_01037 [Wallemia ichthyophaga]TIB24468.1 hypothetical protein E3P89_00991 [Wallemia ichthyophaga]